MSNTVKKPNEIVALERGFSLIELLVVIAVIAILAALIFPVFSTAREKGRQATVMSSYQKISKALAAYQLDHGGQAPQVLFGYAIPKDGSNPASGYFPMNQQAQGLKAAQTAGTTAQYASSLVPNYINDYTIFQDPNNPVTDLTATVTRDVNTVDPSTGALKKTQATFFVADGLDLSPLITGPDLIDKNTLVPRYQASWTALATDQSQSIPGGLSLSVYDRQMAIPSSPGETYVTMTTYHVQQANKVLVLFKSGTAKTLDTSQLLNGKTDVSDIATQDNVTSPYKFWQYTPTGY